MGYNLVWKPLTFVTDPEGPYVQVILNGWWMQNENSEVAFAEIGNRLYPQCNTNKSIVNRMNSNVNVNVVFVPLAFVPIYLEDFRD